MSLLGSQLDAFLSVVKHGTVHAAAEELHLTQTAVTQRIKSLETKLKTTLFTRSRRGMALTTEGEALLHYCQAAQQLEGQVLAQIQGDATEVSTELCVVGPSSVMRSRIIPSCIEVAKAFPQLRFHFDVTDGDARVKALKEGKADFAILAPQDVANEMQSKPLKPEEYVLVAPKAWETRKLKEILKTENIVDFDPSDAITLHYLQANGFADFIKPDRHFANRTDAVAQLVVSELGYSTLTREYAQRFVDRGELVVLNQGKSYEDALSLAWYKRPEPPAYFSAVIEGIS